MGIKVIITVIFLVISVISIWFLLSPAVNHEKTLMDDDVIDQPNGLSYNGMLLRYDAWKTYPEYNIGLGVIAGLGFTGAVLSFRSLYKEKVQNETD